MAQNHVSSLFLLTGILYALAVVNTGITFISDGYNYQALGAVLLLAGLLSSLLAIIGIYSNARNASPGLAKVTGVIAGLAAVLVLVILTLSVGSRLDLLPATPPPMAMIAIFCSY